MEPQRLDVVTLSRPLSVGEFEQRYPSTVPTRTLALINQVEATGSLEGLAKRVVGEPAQRDTASSTPR